MNSGLAGEVTVESVRFTTTEVAVREANSQPERAVDNCSEVRGVLSDVLRITLENGDDVIYVPNEDFSIDNPALQVLAHMGISPSTLDEACGETVHAVRLGPNDYQLSQTAVEDGKSRLHESTWGPEDVTENVPDVPTGAITAMPNGGGDGSDPTA